MSDIIWVTIITGLVSIITSCINRLGNKKFLDRIAEGTQLGLENDIVIFDALRRHSINGESEEQERRMNEYFLHTTTDSFFRKAR